MTLQARGIQGSRADSYEKRLPWLPILMYHRVVARVDRPDPYHLYVSVADLDAQMRFLHQRGYKSMTLEELGRIVATGGWPRGRHVVITFDDGYRDVYVNALPVLERYGFTANVMLVSGQIGGRNVWESAQVDKVRLLGPDDLEAMMGHGVAFGSHGVTHKPLTFLSADEARREVEGSREALERLLGLEVRSFSFPHGRSSPAIRDMVRQAGYLAACGIEQREHSLFNLCRVDVAACQGNWFLWIWKISGLHHRLRQSHMLRRAWGLWGKLMSTLCKGA